MLFVDRQRMDIVGEIRVELLENVFALRKIIEKLEDGILDSDVASLE